MSIFILYRIAAALLTLGLLGHTLGGMLGTARKGPGAGPEADQVFASMNSVHFNWRGADSTWYDFWMGNGLGVSALRGALSRAWRCWPWRGSPISRCGSARSSP